MTRRDLLSSTALGGIVAIPAPVSLPAGQAGLPVGEWHTMGRMAEAGTLSTGPSYWFEEWSEIQQDLSRTLRP